MSQILTFSKKVFTKVAYCLKQPIQLFQFAWIVMVHVTFEQNSLDNRITVKEFAANKTPIASWSSLMVENFFLSESIASLHLVSYIMQQLLASQRFPLIVRLNFSFWMTSESKCCSWHASCTIYFPQHVRSSNKCRISLQKGFQILCMWDFCVVFYRLKTVCFRFDTTAVNNSPRQKRIKLVRNNSS